MIPVTQTKFVVRNSKDEIIVRGNCYAAVIASLLELPITEVPNVEIFFQFDGFYWDDVMREFLRLKGYELISDIKFKVYHDGNYGVDEQKSYTWEQECRGKYYLVSGESYRGVKHICIYQNGKLIHDPHPSKEGLITFEIFQTLEKIKPCTK